MDSLDSIVQTIDGWTFHYTFDNEKGITAPSEIKVSIKEAADMAVAFKLSITKASERKKEWLKKMEIAQYTGPIKLP